MFGGAGASHLRGDSTQASSMHQTHNLLTTTQPPIGKDTSPFMGRDEANESTFFYNSDEEKEVEEILQQSNRLMDRRNMENMPHDNDEERQRELQRQKLELLSLQHPTTNNESTTYQGDESHLNDFSGVNIGDLSRMKYPPQQEQYSREIPSQIFGATNDDQTFKGTDHGRLDQSSVLKCTPGSLNETDAYPHGRVRNLMSTETDESHLVQQHQQRVAALLRDQDEAAQTQAQTQSSTHTIQPIQAIPSHLQPHLALESDRQTSTCQNTERESTILGASMTLFNRERPLLDKIKSMRLEQTHMQNQLTYMEQENEQLKQQLKLYQSNDLGGDSRLKKHIQLLQDEVKYLTQINSSQEETLRLQAKLPQKRTVKRNSSKSATRNRRKSQLRADIERSRSGMLRDCCLQKQQAVEMESFQQQKRIADNQRKYSPHNASSSRISHHHNSTYTLTNVRGGYDDGQSQYSMRSDNLNRSNNRLGSRRDLSRSITPTKRSLRTKAVSSSQFNFEPLPQPNFN